MSQPELPDLKKKEKERKKAGVAWSFGQKAGSFEGALGANGARSAASAAARAASQAFEAVGSRAATWIGRLLERALGTTGWLARLISPLMGSAFGELAAALMLAGALAGVVGAGLYAAAMLMGLGDAPKGGISPELGALSDTLRPKGAGVGGLDYLRGKGLYGEAAKNTETQKAPPTDKETAKQDDPATNTELDGQRPSGYTDRLAHNLSGAKLSSSLGGEFGKGNIFAGNSPKFGGIANGLGLSRTGQAKGKTSGLRNPAKQRTVARGRGMGLKSPRAIGQLKGANALSGQAINGPTTEAASTLAHDAFDGHISPNAPPPISPLDSPSPTPSPTPGPMPGPTPSPTPLPTPTPIPTCVESATNPCNVSPWQPDLDQIKQLAAMAGKLKMMGMMMMALGAILIAIGAMMPVGGWALITAGIALIAMGVMMLQQAAALKAKAEAIAAQVAAAQGQTTHAADTNECINESYNNGGNTPASCQGSQQVNLNSTAGEDAQTESQSGYTTTSD
jgi:hypothetical protein